MVRAGPGGVQWPGVGREAGALFLWVSGAIVELGFGVRVGLARPWREPVLSAFRSVRLAAVLLDRD